MTTAPYVELRFNPTDLRPRDLPSAGAYLGSPADAIEAGLAMVRARMVAQMRAEVRGLTEPTYGQLLQIADLAWQLFLPQYRRVSAPVMADAYIRAYRAADAGDVPMSVIYDLADKHAEKVGDYFHASSRDALADGFNTMVNRRIPARAAADRVLDAYGLTPRQMRGYANNKQLVTPVDSPVSLDVRARSRVYIDKSFTTRIRKLSEQEEHNIDQQAQQFAWMWLQEKGRLSEKAQKVWITAHDERVCPVCGPLHGQKVGINEQFTTHLGGFWTPGIHPNCRCEVRMIENRFSKADVDDWNPKLHPRGGDPENKGRFSRVAERDRPQGDVINIAEPEVIEQVQAPAVADIPLSALADIRTNTMSTIADISAPADIAAPAATADIAAPVADITAPVADIAAPQADIFTLLQPAVAPPRVSDIEVIPNEPKPKKKRPFQQIEPLDEAYYKVVSGDPGYQQHDQEVYSADRDQVILDAAEVREQAINSMMAQHVVDGMVKFKEKHSSYGVPLEARIPEEEFRNILEVVAQHTTSDPPNDALVELEYFDPEGYYTDPPLETQGRTVLDIAHAVGVDPDHLAVHVAKLESVHSENVGRGTAQHQQVAGHPYDEYAITGEYGVNDYSPEYEEGTGTPVGMDIYTYEPHDPAIGYMEE